MELFTYQNSRPVWVSFENPTGGRGLGGQENFGAKGRPFEYFAAGEEKVLCDVQGPGVVRRIWFTMEDRSPEALKNTWLRAWWDGEEEPSVNVPVGDFFCMGAGRMVPFENGLFASPEGRSFVCAIPMPFQKSAKMTLFNGTGRDNPHLFYDVDLTMEDLPEDAMRFHAAFTCSCDLPLGKDVPVLPQVQGQGRFLGMNVAIQINPAYGESWWGEGEVKVYLDGEEAPSLVGTGTEDYIGTAWGQGEFVSRSQGCLHHREGGVSFYRFHLDDPVFFNRGCQVDIQDIGGCSIGEAKRLAEAGAELIPVGADTGGHMTHLYRRDWDWSQLLEEAFITFYRRDAFDCVAYFYLRR